MLETGETKYSCSVERGRGCGAAACEAAHAGCVVSVRLLSFTRASMETSMYISNEEGGDCVRGTDDSVA